MEERIGFGKRLGAAVIDAVIVMVVGSIIGSVFGGLLGGAAGATSGDSGSAALGGILGAAMGAAAGVAIAGLLYGLIEAFKGASPGKMILKIKIGNEDGTPAEVATLLKRYAIKNISMICSLITLITGLGFVAMIGNLLGLIIFIGCFMVLGAARQAIHDKLAKTAVFPVERFSGMPAA